MNERMIVEARHPMKPLEDLLITQICERALPNGGFSGRIGGRYRPDATAWAVMALAAFATRQDLVEAARSKLAGGQMEDGRVSLSPDCPEAIWSTPLAIMAWDNLESYREAQARSIAFLLGNTGKPWDKKDDAIVGHDTRLRGWPWIIDTHSWVEPTSWALLALECRGYGDHERAQEARRMLWDRQLEGGGWNYGNTSVFGQQLRPMPTSTGVALHALAPRLPRENVEKSLRYLQGLVGRLATPLSLAWTLLGLGAWGMWPAVAGRSLLQCFHRQSFYGPYATQELSLLLLSVNGERGLPNLVRIMEKN